MRVPFRVLCLLACSVLLLAACKPRVSEEQKAQGLKAFATVEQVFQHPRCSNCHIPGDQPLQFDSQTPHMMNVVRGPEGKGAAATARTRRLVRRIGPCRRRIRRWPGLACRLRNFVP